jgi:hypothetical protein
VKELINFYIELVSVFYPSYFKKPKSLQQLCGTLVKTIDDSKYNVPIGIRKFLKESIHVTETPLEAYSRFKDENEKYSFGYSPSKHPPFKSFSFVDRALIYKKSIH